MQVIDRKNPLFHFLLASGLLVLSFAVCEVLHLLDPMHLDVHGRPEVHLVFVPYGMMVLLAWIYGWMVVPLVLPVMLVAAAYLVGPDHMTPTVAALTVARVVFVMLALELVRMVFFDPRQGTGRAALVALFWAGVISAVGFAAVRVAFSPCCDVMSPRERVVAFAASVGADMAGLVIVMAGAMFLFRALRHD